MSFLAKILPEQGVYCVVQMGEKYAKHFWHDKIEDVITRFTALDNQGSTVFVAQATFAEAGTDFKGRKRDNAAFHRNFFLDIDCGVGKPYADQKEGILALRAFCDKVSLPYPSVVSSGNGLYAHWVLTKDISSAMWNAASSLLQGVVKAVEPGLDVDGICADAARILRPVGATHRKDANNPKPVRLVTEFDPIAPEDFVRIVMAASAQYKVAIKKPEAPPVSSSWLAGLETEHRPSSGIEIAKKCAQIAHIRDTKGNVFEPFWYAAVGLLRHCAEGADLVHKWSVGHPDYNAGNTDAKILQHETNNIGPTLCATFDKLNGGVCTGCKNLNKVKSPIQLGYAPLETTKIEDMKDEDQDGFSGVFTSVGPYTVYPEGIRFTDGEEQLPVYPYPLFIEAINSDYSGESVTVRHKLPHEGWKSFSVPSSKVADPKGFFSTMLDNHVQLVGKEAKGHFMSYYELMMQKVRASQKITQLVTSMGWDGPDGALKFHHGLETHLPDGTTTKTAYTAGTPEFVKSLLPKGEVAEWVEMTKVFNEPGMEGLAFEFLCSAFGAPLVRFTGFEGAMVSVVGDSGVGKTVTAKFGLSAWGNPDRLMLLQDDTKNAIVSRLGAYGSLPTYMDEISNIQSEELSDFVYKITHGREKLRLDKSARERKNINTWNTLAVVSSNQSLMDKLSVLKGDASAELNRVFEYEVYGGFDKAVGARMSRMSSEICGVVGGLYANYLTIHQNSHKDKLETLSHLIDKTAKAEPGERFWTMIGAVAIYGGMVAKKLGLSHVSAEKLIPWVCDRIVDMRKYKKSSVFDAVSWLGEFMDRHANEFICVASYDPSKKWDAAAYREPRQKLLGRIEEDKEIMWISIDAIKRDLKQQHISYRKFQAMLQASKGGAILTNHDARCTLGRGTIYSSVMQRCWQFDLSHPELGRKALQAVKHRQEDEKKAKGVK